VKFWDRASRLQLCGRCGRHIEKGDPLLVITIGSTVQKVRCATCDGPAPPDLPPFISTKAEFARAPIALRGLLPLDWKALGAGDRQPGEDD